MGKFTYFRHSVDSDDDLKLREFSRLLGRRSKEAYHYFFRMIELCAKESEDGQTEFKFHVQTVRSKWETTTQNVSEVCGLLTQSALIGCRVVTNHVECSVPNLPKYLGSYDAKESKRKRKEKENKIINSESENEAKKNLPEKDSQEILKKPSPLSFLFDHMPEVQIWLNEGNHDTHGLILKNFPQAVLTLEIPEMYSWAFRNSVRAEAWMHKRLLNIDLNKAQKPTNSVKSRATPDNPTGDPYLAQLKQIRKNGESA